MQVFTLHKEFSEGRETTEQHNSQCSEWPPTRSSKINVNTVRTLTEDRSLTCRKIAALINYSKSTIKNIMKKPGMQHVVST